MRPIYPGVEIENQLLVASIDLPQFASTGHRDEAFEYLGKAVDLGYANADGPRVNCITFDQSQGALIYPLPTRDGPIERASR